MKRAFVFLFVLFPLPLFAVDVCPAGYTFSEYTQNKNLFDSSVINNYMTGLSVTKLTSSEIELNGTSTSGTIKLVQIDSNKTYSFYLQYVSGNIRNATGAAAGLRMYDNNYAIATAVVPNNPVIGGVYKIENARGGTSVNWLGGEGVVFENVVFRIQVEEGPVATSYVPYGYGYGVLTVHCFSCPPNTYKPNAGNEACTPCPDGSFSPVGSTAIEQCARILHVGDYIVYMPVDKRTEHGLCTMLDGVKYCADMYERQ